MTSSTILYPAATDKQLSFISALATQRPQWSDVLNGNDYERCFDLMTGSGKFIGKAEASSLISALLAIKPAPKVATTSTTVTTTGLDLADLAQYGTKTNTGTVVARFGVPGGDTRLKVQVEFPPAGKWGGWVFVKDAAEYGHAKRYGSQKPGANYQGDVAQALTAIVADPKAALVRYAELTSRCGVCGRKLEDEDSVARGIGPVCAAKVGW